MVSGRRGSRKAEHASKLVTRTSIKVRFNEVDSLGIAWHGHYVKYFEDGREAFGAEHGLGYLDVYENGLVIPIVSLTCNYRQPLQYGDSILVETTYVDSPAAKIEFHYKVFRLGEQTLVAEGSTTQVFLDAETRTLLLNSPDFFENWKKRVLAAAPNS